MLIMSLINDSYSMSGFISFVQITRSTLPLLFTILYNYSFIFYTTIHNPINHKTSSVILYLISYLILCLLLKSRGYRSSSRKLARNLSMHAYLLSCSLDKILSKDCLHIQVLLLESMSSENTLQKV